MKRSTSVLSRSVVALATLGTLLVGARAAQAQYPLVSQQPVIAKGFQITMSQQRLWQRAEEAPYRVAAPEPAEMTIMAPRYVTIIDPNGRARAFQIEGPVTVVPVRQTVVHFGANNTEGPVAWVPVRQAQIHFGANH